MSDDTSKLRERLESNTFVFYCQRYCENETTDYGVRREITISWEHEHGDFGEKLSSWPVFQVKPPCSGPHKDTYNIDLYKTSYERSPDDCPFSESQEGYPVPEIELLLAQSRERHICLALLNQDPYKAERIER